MRPDTPKWPQLPEYYTNTQIGDIIGWGRAEAGARNAITRLCKADIDRIKGKLSKDSLEKIRDFYQKWADIEPVSRQPTAPERARLIDEILKRW